MRLGETAGNAQRERSKHSSGHSTPVQGRRGRNRVLDCVLEGKGGSSSVPCPGAGKEKKHQENPLSFERRSSSVLKEGPRQGRMRGTGSVLVTGCPSAGDPVLTGRGFPCSEGLLRLHGSACGSGGWRLLEGAQAGTCTRLTHQAGRGSGAAGAEPAVRPWASPAWGGRFPAPKVRAVDLLSPTLFEA